MGVHKNCFNNDTMMIDALFVIVIFGAVWVVGPTYVHQSSGPARINVIGCISITKRACRSIHNDDINEQS